MMRFAARDDRPMTDAAARALAPLDGVLARLLYARGVETAAQAEAFLYPTESQLHDPLRLSGVAEAVALLRQARDERVRVAVYGDYDVDGMCATALMVEALTAYGLEARAHTPSREEGYGLNLNAVEALSGEYGLLLTVDLGVSNHAEVRAAQALGMRVIVTDHHQLALENSPADAVVSPLLGDYPCRKLCGTGVAYKLAQALLGADTARQWLDLAALATVADVVPLVDENRALVALGLPRIAEGARPGLRALLAVSGVKGDVESDTLGFQLGPRINAAGRMGEAAPAVRLLLTRDEAEAEALARTLDELNTLRKQTEREILAQAQEQAAAFDFVQNRLLCVTGDDWHTGVIGLVAGRLCQQYYRPTVALSRQGELAHGSLRSIPGVNIHRCLQACDDLLLRYGGHEQAAGVTLEAAKLDAFLARLEAAVAESAKAECFVPTQVYDARVELGEITRELVEQLQLLRPFGFGNPAPLLLARDARVERKRACGAAGAHLQLTLRQGGAVLDGIGFGLGPEAAAMPPVIDVCFAARENEYLGRRSLQCDVKAWAPAAGAAEAQLSALSPEDWRFALLDALPPELPAPPQAGKSDARGEWYQDTGALPPGLECLDEWLQAPEGTLLLTRAPGTAAWAARRFGGRATLCVGAPTDARCFNALVALPRPDGLPRGYRRVALLDGELYPGEADRWRALLPQAALALPPAPSPALCALAGETDAGDESYRALYRALRRGDCRALSEAARLAGLTPAQTHAGLTAFAQLGLLAYQRLPFSVSLLPPAPCALRDSPVLGALRALSHPLEEAMEC